MLSIQSSYTKHWKLQFSQVCTLSKWGCGFVQKDLLRLKLMLNGSQHKPATI